MSTLPFLLSVADELDNVNSQNYLDDFGLGFHPHRQYYRTPSIQLSLPASTDWMQERQRCRTHKFIDETQNNLQEETTEDAEQCEAENNSEDALASGAPYSGGAGGISSSGPSSSRQQKYSSKLNSNSNNEDEIVDNIDNSVQMYKVSKKCCKNYHRHSAKESAGSAERCTSTSADGYRLHTKCLEANNSSSEESLQKVSSSSIEFLTCFLVKKSRTPKHAAVGEQSGKKS